MAHKDYDKIARNLFEHELPKNYQEDWADLRHRVMDR